MEDSLEIFDDKLDLFSLVRRNTILESILDCIFDDLFIIDKNGVIVYISQNTSRNLGINRDETIGKLLSLTSIKITRHIIPNESFERGIIVGPSFKNIEVVIFSTDEEEVMAGCRKSFCFQGEDGHIFKDMTKLKGMASQLRQLKKVLGSKFGFDNIVGNSEAIEKAKSLAYLAAQSDSTVLLYGESGVGKELFAHAIHSISKRKNLPFIKVDCAGIPDNLLESELFGYEEGAFTGARKGGKPGRFERAHKGTLFLDEVGDMGLPMQVKLLRVLQEKEIERVGGTETLEIDVRVIASTRFNLQEKIQKGEFREDLFYRLEVIPIYIPPLRERKEDIPLFVKHFLNKLNKKTGKEIRYVSEDVMTIFKDYSWPGNIRELENVIEGAMNLTNGEIIGVKSLPLTKRQKNIGLSKLPSISIGESMKDIEVAHIRRALELTHGNKRKASKVLGIPRSTFYIKLKKYGL
ncbi:MAG: sigma 54-interacting transcriptional regulator [Nitrospirota bacterium]